MPLAGAGETGIDGIDAAVFARIGASACATFDFVCAFATYASGGSARCVATSPDGADFFAFEIFAFGNAAHLVARAIDAYAFVFAHFFAVAYWRTFEIAIGDRTRTLLLSQIIVVCN